MERRNNHRADTRVALQARAHGRTFSTQLYDISPTGCRFDCSALLFSRGDRVVFKINDHVKVTGKIAWRHGDTAGVQFRSQLPDEITQHFHWTRTNSTVDDPQDWFLR